MGILETLFPMAAEVKAQTQSIDYAVQQSVVANPTWTYDDGLPEGRAEQMVRERTASGQTSAVVPPAPPASNSTAVLWLLGLGGVALWFLMKKR